MSQVNNETSFVKRLFWQVMLLKEKNNITPNITVITCAASYVYLLE